MSRASSPLRRSWLLATLGLVLARPGAAQSGGEARVKSRLTANLARFTHWPAGAFAGASEPIGLCVLHRNAVLGAAFEELAGVAVGPRTLRVQLNPASLQGCHVLYVEAEAERAAAPLLAQAAGKPVLTVGDGADFVQRGMVELVNVNDAMRFDVHLGRMRRTQLDLPSQALRLARQVLE